MLKLNKGNIFFGRKILNNYLAGYSGKKYFWISGGRISGATLICGLSDINLLGVAKVVSPCLQMLLFIIIIILTYLFQIELNIMCLDG